MSRLSRPSFVRIIPVRFYRLCNLKFPEAPRRKPTMISETQQQDPPGPSDVLEACCLNERFRADRDAVLKAMDSILGPSQADAVLSILDGRSIHRLETSQRSITVCRSNVNRSEFYFCSYRPGRIQYCSCRSFQEKRKAPPSAGGTPPLCKHLLALKLLPLLSDNSNSCVVVEKYGTPEEFSRAVCRKLSINK